MRLPDLKTVLTLLAALVLALSLASAAMARSYRIRPGDVLRIEVIEDPSLNRSVLVSPDGRDHRAAGRGGAGRRARRGRGASRSRRAAGAELRRRRPTSSCRSSRSSRRIAAPVTGDRGRRRTSSCWARLQPRPGRGRAGHDRAAVLRRDGRLFELCRDQAHPVAPGRFLGHRAGLSDQLRRDRTGQQQERCHRAARRRCHLVPQRRLFE